MAVYPHLIQSFQEVKHVFSICAGILFFIIYWFLYIITLLATYLVTFFLIFPTCKQTITSLSSKYEFTNSLVQVPTREANNLLRTTIMWHISGRNCCISISVLRRFSTLQQKGNSVCRNTLLFRKTVEISRVVYCWVYTLLLVCRWFYSQQTGLNFPLLRFLLC